MEGIVLVGGVLVGVRVRQPPEGISAPHQPIVAESIEHGPHEDEGAAPPDARLDEVAGHGIGHQGLDALLEVVEAPKTDHRLGGARHVPSAGPGVTVVVDASHELEVLPAQKVLEQVVDRPLPGAGRMQGIVALRERRSRETQLQELQVPAPSIGDAVGQRRRTRAGG